MCRGEAKLPAMEGGVSGNSSSVLLELAASDDLVGFKAAVEEQGLDLNEPSLWYGRRIGSKKMSFEERTPTMIAAAYGSKAVLGYLLGTGSAQVNAASGSDGATALHCAAAGASSATADVVELLLTASADPNSVDASGKRPKDLLDSASPKKLKESPTKRQYDSGVLLPDINEGIYGTDDFRMYAFKVKACSRAYTHDWTECPFVHPGENARRRDPRVHLYSCVPCPEFRKAGECRRGDACDYAHGVFECWLHPAQYRTRLCKDESACRRRVCFFAHHPHELRPLYASTGSAVPPSTQFYSGPFDGTPTSDVEVAAARRSRSFVERSVVVMDAASLADWGSPSGKLDWGTRKWASFGLRSTNFDYAEADEPEPDVSWVQSLVVDQQLEEQQLVTPAWVEQMYLEQEQLVA